MLSWKLAKLLVSFSKSRVNFSSNFPWISVMKDSSVSFLRHMLKICSKWINQSTSFWNFECFLSFFKQVGFSSSFTSLFIIIRHNSSVPFSWNFIYFQWKYKFGEISPLKFWTLMSSFCKNHINIQLKKYRRVICHETEEACEV